MVIISLTPWILGLILGILLLKRRDLRSLIRAGTHLFAHMYIIYIIFLVHVM